MHPDQNLPMRLDGRTRASLREDNEHGFLVLALYPSRQRPHVIVGMPCSNSGFSDTFCSYVQSGPRLSTQVTTERGENFERNFLVLRDFFYLLWPLTLLVPRCRVVPGLFTRALCDIVKALDSRIRTLCMIL